MLGRSWVPFLLGIKNTYESPTANGTHDLPSTGRALYPLSYENSLRARSLNWVHMWQRTHMNPQQEWNPWPPEHWAGALSTELRELTESKVTDLTEFICDKEHIWIPNRNGTHDLPNTGRVIYPLCYENSRRARSLEHIWIPDRNGIHDLPNTGRARYSLSYENSRRAKSLNWVYTWRRTHESPTRMESIAHCRNVRALGRVS